MMNWGQFMMQNSVNSIMECIIYFHDYMMMILLMILVFVMYSMSLILIKKNLDKLSLESHFLEMIWTIIPMIILLFMAYPSLVMLYFMEASEFSNLDLNIKVIGHQWYWEYEIMNEDSFDSVMMLQPKNFYTLETINYLTLPINKMISLYVTSNDVIHSFTIPSCGIKVDAIPARINILYFYINMPGVYFGQCSEICGVNHSFMPIHILAK